MKSNKTKKIILLLLLALLIVIWIGNFSVFENQTAYNLVGPSKTNKISKAKDQMEKIEYKKPKLNPFSVPETVESKKEIMQNAKRAISPEIVKISGRYIIDGIVTEKENPQAILRIGDRSGILISIGDSLDGWRIDKILGEQIVLSQGKNRDTLRLQIK